MTQSDFPGTILEFSHLFPDEESCIKFVIQSRWPDGFKCPRCGHKQYYWKQSRHLLQCKNCKYQASPTAGTIMHRSRIPLTIWFQAAYFFTVQTPGISALRFQSKVGLSTYQSAFFLFHKLRAAMAGKGQDKLRGVVDVSETYISGGKQGRVIGRPEKSQLIACALNKMGKVPKSIRLKVLSNTEIDTLVDFVIKNVQSGSTINMTNAFEGHAKLESLGYKYVATSNPGYVHQVFANLKTLLSRTHHRTSPQHLQYYLDEYTYRFNNRFAPMNGFKSLLGLMPENSVQKRKYPDSINVKQFRHPSGEVVDLKANNIHVQLVDDNKKRILKVLQNSILFKNASENELINIADKASILHFRQGETIIRESEIPNYFYVIEKGLVKVFKTIPTGREFIINFRGVNETFGPNSSIENLPYFATVVAAEDTDVLAIRREVFIGFVIRNPIIRANINYIDKLVIDSLYDKMIDLATDSAAHRVIKVLNSLANRHGNILTFTHQEVADMSLTTLETTTRILSRLKNLGIIITSRGKINIMDREKLRLEAL